MPRAAYVLAFPLGLIAAAGGFPNVSGQPRSHEYWSLSKYAKQKVKNAVSFISKFEEIVAHEAGARGVDGVIAGHIHQAEIRQITGIEYYNDGDWVEGCTALVEHYDGTMEILHWADEIAARDAPESGARLEAA